MRVLYDGWDLAYQPNSPAALHLLTLLDCAPPAVQAVVGLPASAFHPLPEDVETRILVMPDSPAGRLSWEQRRFPGLANGTGADLVHSFGGTALFGRKTAVLSPAEVSWDEQAGPRGEPKPGLAARLRESLGQGGQARLRALFWPADLAEVGTLPWKGAPRLLLPPVVHPAFVQPEQPEPGRPEAGTLTSLSLPETFVLYHGSGNPAVLRRLLAAWSWASGPVGEYYPLLAAGLNEAERLVFDKIAAEFELERSVRSLPALSIHSLAALYRASNVVFHPAETSPWGGSLRIALACAKPVVGLETRMTDALLGPAGYLVRERGTPAEVNRALGAALITVIVEESLATSLVQQARERASVYKKVGFSRELGAAYHALLNKAR